MVTDAAEHGWLCGPLIRGRSPVRFRVLRLRAGKCPAGAHNPSLPGAVPGPATIVRTVAPPRRRAARSGSGALAHQEEHLTCNEEAVGSSPTSSTIQPRWWSWPTRLPLKEEITGSNPVRGTSTAGGDQPGPDRRRARRRGGTQTRRTQNPVPQGVGVQVPPSAQRLPPRRAPGLCTAGSGGRHPGEALRPTRRPQAEVMERRHASLRSWCPPGRASASLAFRTKAVRSQFHAPPAPARTRRSYRRWRGSAPRGGSGRPSTINAEVVER